MQTNSNMYENAPTPVPDPNRYTLVGWLCIANAILFPMIFVIAIIQGIISSAIFEFRGPIFGPSDLLSLLSTGIWIYALIKLRHLLNERYNFHDIDNLIIIAILWNVIFQISGMALKGMALFMSYRTEMLFAILGVALLVIAMITAGIINIMIAIKLLQIKEKVNDLIKAFTYIIMAAGISQVTIILSPLSVIMVPILNVILGMMFLREKEEAEFV